MNELTREIMKETGISTEGMSDEELRDLESKSEKIATEWKSLRITSDFIFCKVMQDKELLEELIRMILPELEFEDLEIYSQKSIEIGKDIHGVRFDVFVKNNRGTVMDIEMQVLDNKNMPKRMRYYGSMSDTALLEKGEYYNNLHDRYVISICTFDYYKKGLHRYTFTNRCHEVENLEMGDGTTKILLNALGEADDVHGRLKEFLNYVAGEKSEDEYVKKLDDAVDKARRNKEWRREFVMISMRDMDKKEEGRKEGEIKTFKLIDLLTKQERFDEIQKACNDLEYRKKLFEEFDI